MFVAGPWSRGSDDSYDVGMVALAPSRGSARRRRGGRPGHRLQRPARRPRDRLRLPGRPALRRLSTWSTAPSRLRDDPYGDTHDQGLGCDMTAGSSGGPWLTRFDTSTGRGTITSVSSFKYSDDRRTMYGPILGEPARKLFHTAERA
ncbi:hypothetical protein ACFSTC_44780 [Nonomuraea ferruginea]